MQTGSAKPGRLWKLFLTMLYISAFTFGGGFVIVSLMKKRFVDDLGWLSESEMLDMTALAQSAPGAIAVNTAILAGGKVAGTWGVAAAVIGTILPPMIVLSILSIFYNQFANAPAVQAVLRGMQAGVAAVIADVTLSLGKSVAKEHSWLDWAILALAFVAVAVFHINVAFVLIATALVGVGRYLYWRASNRKAEKAQKTADLQSDGEKEESDT